MSDKLRNILLVIAVFITILLPPLGVILIMLLIIDKQKQDGWL